MTSDEKLDAILADTSFLRGVVERMGWGGPRVIPGDGSTPTPPAPPPPVEPPSTPPVNPIQRPANIPQMVWDALNAGHENDGKPADTGPTAPAVADGGGYDRPNFDFRNGDILRWGGSGARSVTAAYPAGVTFSVGDSGGNQAKSWRITVRKNGLIVDTREASTYQTVPDVPVRVAAGDTITLELAGDGISLSARMSVTP